MICRDFVNRVIALEKTCFVKDCAISLCFLDDQYLGVLKPVVNAIVNFIKQIEIQECSPNANHHEESDRQIRKCMIKQPQASTNL